MQANEIEAELSKRFKILTLILTVLLLSTVTIGVFLPSLGVVTPKANPNLSLNPSLLIGVGVFEIVFAFVLKKMFFRPKLGDDVRLNVTRVCNLFFSTHIVCFAFFEAAAIMGFVVFLLTGEIKSSYLMSALAVGAMILAWPKKEALLQCFSRYGVRGSTL